MMPQENFNSSERDSVLQAYNELRTTVDNPPPEVTHKTRHTTQWGYAGPGAQMMCGGDPAANLPACAMFTPDEHTNYQDGHCELGWRTFRRYTCNEWKPAQPDRDADDR